MVKKSKGPRRRTRRKLRKRARQRGKLSVARYMQKFEIGDKVVVKPEPAVQKGLPHRRFFGKLGVIAGQRGRAYLVELRNGGKIKKIICLPIHLKKVS
jgi:large subunit ribosomal protein L21e